MRTFSKLLLLLSLIAASYSLPAHAATCGANAKCITGFATFINADGTTAKTVYTSLANGNGTKITGIYCVSTQPSGGIGLSIAIVHNSISYPLNFVQYNVIGGTNQTPVANVLITSLFMFYGGTQPWTGLPTDENGNVFLFFGPGDSLTFAAGTAVTSPYTATCYALLTQY